MVKPSQVHPIHLAEAGIWALLVLLAVLTIGTTFGSTFPARSRALLGEAIVLGGRAAVLNVGRSAHSPTR